MDSTSITTVTAILLPLLSAALMTSRKKDGR